MIFVITEIVCIPTGTSSALMKNKKIGKESQYIVSRPKLGSDLPFGLDRESGCDILGFIVNNRGIEANPDKIKVVLDMLPLSNIKGIQRLTRRIAALNRLVSRANDKCRPFFQVLKKAF